MSSTGYAREWAGKLVPRRAAIERHVGAELAAGDEQILVPWMLADDVHRVAFGHAARDPAPAFSVVVAHKDVGAEVVVAVPVERRVDASFRMA